MQKLTPCLWFDDRIEEAAEFYVSVFRDARLGAVQRMPDGKVLTAHVVLFGQTFMLLNGGPQFKFNEAISFQIDCKDQSEVDYYWEALTADGGEESMCAWCKDKYGLSWQVVPAVLPKLIGGSDPAGAQRAMQAMLQMRKIDVATLEKAYAGA
jgi:predicted 3-demethylubiquinone-9 3-methyltransferase (glyoxalase superfamily)